MSDLERFLEVEESCGIRRSEEEKEKSVKNSSRKSGKWWLTIRLQSKLLPVSDYCSVCLFHSPSLTSENNVYYRLLLIIIPHKSLVFRHKKDSLSPKHLIPLHLLPHFIFAVHYFVIQWKWSRFAMPHIIDNFEQNTKH